MNLQSKSAPSWVYVWDPFVRIFHWSVVVLFAVAYLTGDEIMGVHVWAGYGIALLVTIRVIWGFVGPRRARFSDFIYKPSTVLRYFYALLRRRSERHLGHSPAGGAMIVALLIGLAVTCASGLVHYAMEDGAGPLSYFIAQVPKGEHNALLGLVHETHELAANLTLALVAVHITAVLYASYAYRENLIRAMFNGYKRPE
ncbi:putative Ni/Fe-hydrogenase B-type cytochrome subunit [Methyloligella halotolerans]|uniref:Putative Ni/Fe-hydrogenase B-type cytochrome subunit n=1 Tax=Methyloligella halotolerans TaxID=1177755 RepID=A0A1E2RVP4_9HYPH|nr:cytochrome b/b6 domain-containing protein [Methyloligella halotolerans]ODA66307.1 putative Ni/Fe-hydrogenase B-type cytochrome subunit [Methyloligella halotolerans]